MALTSSQVSAGQTILADHINKLRADLVTNHTHTSGEGGTVDHQDLADSGNMSGFNHNHTDVDIHLNGSGPGGNSIDNPGGSQGVHGLATSAYVAGSLGSPLVIQGGTDTLSGGSKAVTFSVAFTTVVSIVGTLIGAKAGDDHYPSDLYITDVSTTGFTMHHQVSSFENNSFYWMAIGTKT